MDKLELVNELLEEVELEIQKALSMTNLNVSPIESFLDVFTLLNKVKNICDSIDDIAIKNVAQGKLKVSILDLETKLSQALV